MQRFRGIHLIELYKVTISTYTQFFNASGLPEKYFLTPSHPNSMHNSILDEE